MAAVNMTEGSIPRHLINYSLPLIAGNLFQLTYNVVDSIIAGRFIGKEALAAEGTANPVMSIVILGISGICMGASVLMSEFFGAGEYGKLKREMSTTVIFGCYFSLAVAVLGVLLAKPLLAALNVPEELLDMASTYLRIIFLGAPFTYFYNAVSSALKSVGDSRTPLKFLAFSAVLNAVLDLIFIGWLGFGIVCSATTTVIAEAASALLCIGYVYRKIPMLHLRWGEFRMDAGLLRQTLRYGSVTALQQAADSGGHQSPGRGYDRRLQRRKPGGRLRVYAGAEHLPWHHHLRGPEPGREENGPHSERLRLRTAPGGMLLVVHFRGDHAGAGAGDAPVRHRGQRGDCGPGQQLSGTDGIFLPVSGLHQRNPGIFPGDGKYEYHPARYLHADQHPGDFRVPFDAADGDAGRGLGLRGGVEHDAAPGGSLLRVVYAQAERGGGKTVI